MRQVFCARAGTGRTGAAPTTDGVASLHAHQPRSEVAMRMRDPCHPTEDELHTWAYSPGAESPAVEWDWLLAVHMERGLLARCVEYAADRECPNAGFFLDVLYQWVEVVARDKRFEVVRSTYDEWLDVARGVQDAKVKDWRYRARLVFQNAEPFDRHRWSDIRIAARERE